MAPEVLAAMTPYLTQDAFANPNSLHSSGVRAKQGLIEAQKTVAECLNTTPETLIWTSGGTESNNLALFGVAETLATAFQRECAAETPGTLITSPTEHSAVLAPAKVLSQQYGWALHYVKLDSEGLINLDHLAQLLANAPENAPILVSLMHGNNEAGTLQPLAAIGELCRRYRAKFHTDAVQTLGKLPLDLSTLQIDYLSGSGHKLYGPKGIGLLWVHPEAPKPSPLLFGGDQQGGLRPGTINVAGCVGFAQALTLYRQTMQAETNRLQSLQQYLLDALSNAFGAGFNLNMHTEQAQTPAIWLNGPADVRARIPGNIHLSYSKPLAAEALLLRLDLAGFYVSSGSACHSGRIEPSHVIRAMFPDNLARAAQTVRITMGRSTTAADLDAFVQAFKQILD